jgi:hypothetical protein
MWNRILSFIAEAWRVAFPMPVEGDPSGPSTVTKAAVLREAARLSENVDATSTKHIA